MHGILFQFVSILWILQVIATFALTIVAIYCLLKLSKYIDSRLK